MQFNFFLLLFGLLFFSGCATGPVSTPHSAQSLGKNNFATSPSLLPLGLGIGYGVSENIDIGAAVETQMQGDLLSSAMLKYSIINQSQGTSLALTGGVFTGNHETEFGVKGTSLGAILSYRLDNYEFFTSLRKNYATWTPKTDSSIENFTNTFGRPPGTDPTNANYGIEYTQAHIGVSFKRSDTLTITIGAMCGQIYNTQECTPLIAWTATDFWERLTEDYFKLFNNPAKWINEKITPLTGAF